MMSQRFGPFSQNTRPTSTGDSTRLQARAQWSQAFRTRTKFDRDRPRYTQDAAYLIRTIDVVHVRYVDDDE